MAEFDVFDDEGTSEPARSAAPDPDAQELLDRIDELRGIDPDSRQSEVTITDDSITVTSSRPVFSDPSSGARVTEDDGEFAASLSPDDGASARFRFSSTQVDSGDLLGPVHISAHGPEVDGFADVGEGRTGAGGHVDAAGFDVRVGDGGNLVKFGLSEGDGAGFELLTGEDSDHNGQGEFGVKFEGGPVSGEVRLEADTVLGAADDVLGVATNLPELTQEGLDHGALDPSGAQPDVDLAGLIDTVATLSPSTDLGSSEVAEIAAVVPSADPVPEADPEPSFEPEPASSEPMDSFDSEGLSFDE